MCLQCDYIRTRRELRGEIDLLRRADHYIIARSFSFDQRNALLRVNQSRARTRSLQHVYLRFYDESEISRYAQSRGRSSSTSRPTARHICACSRRGNGKVGLKIPPTPSVPGMADLRPSGLYIVALGIGSPAFDIGDRSLVNWCAPCNN